MLSARDILDLRDSITPPSAEQVRRAWRPAARYRRIILRAQLKLWRRNIARRRGK